MRKSVVFLVLLVLGLSAGAYVYYYKPFAPAPTVEVLLPGETLVMMRICDLDKQIGQFINGKFGKALAGMDWDRLMTLMDIPPANQMQVKQNARNVKAVINSPVFDSLLGQDVTLAMLNTEIDPALIESGDARNLMDALVVIAKPKHPAAIIDHLTSLFDSRLEKEATPYKEWSVVKISMNPQASLYYALKDELMIAGLSAVPVQRCLDQAGDLRSSLAEFPYYKDYGRDLFVPGKTDAQFYMNAEQVFSKLEVIAEQKMKEDTSLAAFKNQMENMEGIESLHMVQYDDGSPVIQSTIIAGFDRDRLSPRIAHALDISPSKNPTLSKAPANALLYSWQNNFDLANIWEQYTNNPDIKPEDLDKVKQMFAMQTGMDIESFCAMFGNQFGLLLNDVKQGPMFPIPIVALMVELEKPDEVNQWISQMLGKFNINVSEDQHNGVDLQQVVLPMGPDLSPSFTLSDGFLTVAVNRAFLESMIDSTDSTCISTDPNFKAMGDELTDNNNQMFFIQTKDIIDKSKGLITWGMTLMAMTKPEEAEKMGDLMDVGIYPLLDGLTMFKAMGGRVQNRDSAVVSEMKVLVDRG